MRFVVTGGAGFVGSHVVDRLVADDHLVTVVDDLSRGREDNLAAALQTGRCRLVHRDVASPDLSEVMLAAQPEVVIHLAAQIDVRASVADPVADSRVNVLGTVSVLEAARLAGARKVVFVSSVAVYGPGVALPVREDAAAAPLSPYGVSKLAGELYVRQYERLHGLAGTVLVLSNVYGPRQDPNGEAGVVAIFTDALLTGRPTVLWGDGHNIRDYVYVEDVADAVLRASGTAGDGERLHIGTGVATTDLALHAAVADAVGVADAPSFGPARPGDLRAMVLDCTAARRVLEWTATTSLAEGLARTVESARQPSFR